MEFGGDAAGFRRTGHRGVGNDAAEERLSFEVTDEDLADAKAANFGFGYGGPSRMGRRQTKNQATYGIWAEPDGDSDGDEIGSGQDGSGRTLYSSTKQRPPNYAVPVNFVKSQSEKREQNEDGSDGESASDVLTQLGRYSTSGESDEDGDDDDRTVSNMADGVAKSKRKSHVASRSWSRAEATTRPGSVTAASSFALGNQISGIRTQTHSGKSVGGGLGDWERHTRGIGAKLLLQMGYESGKGLGKSLQGRANIVETKLRRGRGAIGAYGSEQVKPASSKAGDGKIDSEEDEESQFKAELRMWRRRGESSKKRVRYVYKTADDVLAASEDVDAPSDTSASAVVHPTHLTNVKVVDLRGPEQRVLSGYHAITSVPSSAPFDDSTQSGIDAHFALPELMANINRLLDACETDIVAKDRTIREHGHRATVVRNDEQRLASQLADELAEAVALKAMLADVERVEVMFANHQIDMDSAAALFRRLRGEPEDKDDEDIEDSAGAKVDTKRLETFYNYQVYHVAHSTVVPLAAATLKSWSPLIRPGEHVCTFIEWQRLLRVPDHVVAGHVRKAQQHIDNVTANSIDVVKQFDPYLDLIASAWLPVVRQSLTNEWSVRQPGPAIALLQHWTPLLPSAVVHHLRDGLILPRLQAAVDEWEPSRDATPIHTWIHPWLDDVLGGDDRLLRPLYPTIRAKLAAALTRWHPSDKSARLILTPWHALFAGDESFSPFFMRHVYPKLEAALADAMSTGLSGSGGDSNTFNATTPPDAWQWAVGWAEMMPERAAVMLCERALFPPWLRSLAAKLNALATPADYQCVVASYGLWKTEVARLPGVTRHAQIAMYFEQALHMMNRAVQGGSETVVPPPSSSSAQTRSHLHSATASSTFPANTPHAQSSFRDVLFQRCADQGATLLALDASASLTAGAGGRQLYRVTSGSGGRRGAKSVKTVYIDRNVLFQRHSDEDWRPVDIDELFD